MANGSKNFWSPARGPNKTVLSVVELLLVFLSGAAILLSSACSPAAKKDLIIRLGYLQNDLHHLPVFVAMEKGFFKAEGLKVETAGIFRAGPEEMSAFAAKELDIGYVGQAPATIAAINGVASIKFLAQVNLEGSAIVVGKKVPYKTLSDLRGKVIAIPGHATMQDFILRKALKDQGMPFAEVTIIVLKPPEMLPALAEGSIDAFIAWEPYPSKALTQKAATILLDSHDIWKNHPCCVLVADTDFLKSNPGVKVKIRDVHRRACSFIQQNPQEAISIGVKYTGMDRATVARALTKIKFDYRLDRQKAAEYIDFLNELTYTNIDQPQEFLNDVIEKF